MLIAKSFQKPQVWGAPNGAGLGYKKVFSKLGIRGRLPPCKRLKIALPAKRTKRF